MVFAWRLKSQCVRLSSYQSVCGEIFRIKKKTLIVFCPFMCWLCVTQTSVARLGGIRGRFFWSVNSCLQRGTGWPAFSIGRIYVIGWDFIDLKPLFTQHWLQIRHSHFKLGSSGNVTLLRLLACDYLGPLCGWAKSFPGFPRWPWKPLESGGQTGSGWL